MRRIWRKLYITDLTTMQRVHVLWHKRCPTCTAKGRAHFGVLFCKKCSVAVILKERAAYHA